MGDVRHILRSRSVSGLVGVSRICHIRRGGTVRSGVRSCAVGHVRWCRGVHSLIRVAGIGSRI
jgi:hypothetical protein